MQVQKIGSYEAKTHLPELLRQVKTGKVFEISIRGQAVARLSPAASSKQQRKTATTKMRQFMQAQLASDVGNGLNLRELIEEGRA